MIENKFEDMPTGIKNIYSGEDEAIKQSIIAQVREIAVRNDMRENTAINAEVVYEENGKVHESLITVIYANLLKQAAFYHRNQFGKRLETRSGYHAEEYDSDYTVREQ